MALRTAARPFTISRRARKASMFCCLSVVGAVVPIVNLPGTSQRHFVHLRCAGGYLPRQDQEMERSGSEKDQTRALTFRIWTLSWCIVPKEAARAMHGPTICRRPARNGRTLWAPALTPNGQPAAAPRETTASRKLVKELGGSIGYVEYIYALQNHVSYGKVRNRNGEFVEASLESIAAAVSHAARESGRSQYFDRGCARCGLVSDRHRSHGSSFRLTSASDAKRTAIASFLRWTLGPGQRQAAALGYLALPKEIVGMETDAIAMIH